MVALTATAAVTWLAAVVTAEIRRAPDANCIAVDSSLMDVIVSRPASGPLEPLKAVAVHDPWTRSNGSVSPFDDYYAVAMQFRRSDGSTSDGVWGFGGGPLPPEGQALTVIADSAPLVNVDQSAWQSTVWPETEMHFPEDANAVTEARQCLSSES